MADNSANRTQQPNQAAATQTMQMPRTSIFGGNDAKRMSFDRNLPFSASPPTGLFGITSGLAGSAPSYNPDRRDSLKNIFTQEVFFAETEEELSR